MWGRRKLNEDGHRMYAVLLHARGLLITDDEGVERIGGAYTWRFVHSPTRESAAKEAIRSLLTAPAFVEAVRNLDEVRVIADEVVAVDRQDESRGSGIVFYIDTNEVT